jgi:toxin CcdB
MAQFDIHRFADGQGRARYVVDLQSDLLSELSTRVVAPAYPLMAGVHRITRLNPELDVKGSAYFLAVQEMAAVKRSLLGTTIGSAAARRDNIIAAIDLLITGI